MRKAREKLYGLTAVHFLSSDLDGALRRLSRPEQAALYELILGGAVYCGLELIAAVVLSRGFALLVRVPEPSEPTRDEILRRVAALHGKGKAVWLSQVFEKNPEADWRRHYLVARCLRNEGDISRFAKIAKQSFSLYYNRKRGERRRIWHDRFRSIMIEDSAPVLTPWVGYICNLPVVERLTEIPEAHAYSTLRLANEGETGLRRLLRSATGSRSWVDTLEKLRSALPGESTKTLDRGDIDDFALERSRLRYALAKNYRSLQRARWQRIYGRLERFYRMHGHTRLDWGWDEDVTLRKWCIAQRALRQSGRLSLERIEALGRIQFDWEGPRYRARNEAPMRRERTRRERNARRRARWKLRYAELKAFRNEYGHTRVPHRYVANKPLANWVWMQRQFRRRGTLADEWIGELDTLGFDWEPRRRGPSR